MSTITWTPRDLNTSVNDDLVFQTLDWFCDDIKDDETDLLEYKIFVFGVAQNDIPVNLCINGFCPFFYVEVPSTWDSSCIYTVRESFATAYIKPKSIEFVEGKRYYGFENNKIRKFLKLSFYSNKALRSSRYKIDTTKFMVGGKEYQFDIYESNIDPVLRFTHIRDILTAGWVKIKKGKYNLDDSEEFYNCNWTSVCSADSPEFSNRVSNVRILYFDIEACSEDGSFPNPTKPNDRCTQICCIIKDTATKNTEKFLFNLGTIDAIEDTKVFQYPSEKKLLLDYAKFMNEIDPDVIVGYNIFGFDNGYLFERAKVLDIESQFNYQSKISSRMTTIDKKVLDNQQSGFNEWKMTRLVGRTHIDLLQVIKKDYKLESYKLDYVGEHFLKQGKDDVSPAQIFEAWSKDKGTREKRTLVGKYCVQDTNLCLLLFEKFAVLPNHLEMAKVTRVPLEYLITRGQSIKVFSQIAYETRKVGYLIPEFKKSDKDSKFQGATVLEAKVGYYQQPVCGLDFASLYPSIMIAHNMCYATVVLDPKYMDIPGVEYSTIAWTTDAGESFSFSFVQNQH
jgi:DNA polymerase delta subunit 1